MKRKRKHTINWYKKQLWKIFTIYIKNRDNWTCYTCGKQARGWGMSGGHFIPKSVGGLILYFHEDNVHAQCSYCNLQLEGNHYEYGLRLGQEKVAELYALRNIVTKWSESDFIDKIKHYKEKVHEQETNKQQTNTKGRRGKRKDLVRGGQDKPSGDSDNLPAGKERSSTD